MRQKDYWHRKRFNKEREEAYINAQRVNGEIIDLAEQKNKKAHERKLRIKYILSQIAFALLTILCCIGIAALSFFFVHQFGFDNGLNPIAVYTIGAAIGAIIFTAYFYLFTVSAFKANKANYEKALAQKTEKEKELSAEEKLAQAKKIAAEKEAILENSTLLRLVNNRMKNRADNSKLRLAFERYLENQAIKSLAGTRKTNLQVTAMIVNVLIGALAIVFLGGGNYLGVMDIGSTLGVASAFQPLAILSAVAMFVTMFSYFLPDMKNNAAAPFKPKPKPTSNEAKVVDANEQKNGTTIRKKSSITAWFIRIGFYFAAIFSSVGFASFKLYSTIHLVQIIGFSNPVIVGITSGVAFVSMLIMGLTTSTVSMWKFADLQSQKYDKVQELKQARIQAGIEAPATPSKPFSFYLAWAITILTAAFNGAGAFIGMLTVCSLYPPLTPLFMIIGALAALSRFAEIVIYYGPVIAENMSGIKTESDVSKVIKDIDQQIADIKSKHNEQLSHKKGARKVVSNTDKENRYEQANKTGVNFSNAGYGSPTTASDKLLKRKPNLAITKKSNPSLVTPARSDSIGTKIKSATLVY